jgi:hypothetical protein
MRKPVKSLNKPNLDIGAIYEECAQLFTGSGGLTARLLLCKTDIVAASATFDGLAQNNEAHKMRESIAGNNGVSRKDLTNLYKQKFSQHSAVRKYYDEIFGIPKNGVCPLCDLGAVTSLDHYLPQQQYPSLAITPANLVAACSDCNRSKLDFVPTSSAEETLHPYYDAISDYQWVYCKISEECSDIFHYYVDMQDDGDELMFKRVKKHFEVFDLGKFYAVRAGSEIEMQKAFLRDEYKIGGEDAVRDYIRRRMEACEHASLNHWKTALYKCMHNLDELPPDWLE